MTQKHVNFSARRRRPIWSFARRRLRPILKLRGSPESIALGVAIGVGVAFTPTIGFQIVIAAVLATLFKASRPAAIIPVWITNPLTIAPIYAGTYWVGELFYPGPSAGRVYQRIVGIKDEIFEHAGWDLWGQFTEFISLGVEIFIPMLIGGLIVGWLLGSISYLVTVWVLRRHHRFLAQRREHRQALRHARIEDAHRREMEAAQAKQDEHGGPPTPRETEEAEQEEPLRRSA